MLTMPALDEAVIGNRERIAADLARLEAPASVIAAPAALRAYESDGLTAYRQPPLVAVLPANTSEVAAVLRYCHQRKLKVVPRGSGTSLSGGALPLADGVLVGLGKLNRVLEIDYDNRCAIVQPGVPNLAISHAVADRGFYYAPDPSSQIACSIGGNVAENSGGVHCLKYGLTTNNLLGLEVVLIDGDVMRVGGRHFDAAGYDLMGILTGSEGLLGVVTEVTVRLLKRPPTARALLAGFASNESAGEAVAAIIAAGIIPAGMEMMDKPAVAAVEDFVHAGYPLEAEALLIVELDGTAAEVDELMSRVQAIAQGKGATSLRVSQSEQERLKFWAGRKAAFPAVGRISPDYYCMDGTIPRSKLPLVLTRMAEMSERFGLKVANVFHAGDGNLHPLIMFDANDRDSVARAEAFGFEILELCVAVGGTVTGEHGVGVEKVHQMCSQFDRGTLDAFFAVKRAFDPPGLLNPGKVVPTLHRCAEYGRMHVHGGALKFPDLPRF